MKKVFLISLILFTCSILYLSAQPVSLLTAETAAQNWVSHHDGFTLYKSDVLTDDQGEILGYQYELSPIGYLVFSANKSLSPIIAYSLSSVPSVEGEEINPLHDMLVRDLRTRLEHLDLIPWDARNLNQSRWKAMLEKEPDERTFHQWPPAGSTSTGGWVETNWSQSHPYNKFCPMDNVNIARSVAGCPAVALSMIIHYQKNLNGTQFSDNDDYYHSYAGRQYWIDDDAHGWDFPTFPDLNEYFDSIGLKFLSYSMLNEDEIAALVFGCGVAAQQVYTSEVSGTFGVDQAYDAYIRFGYTDAMLIYDSDTSFYTQMKNNIKNSRPVHLAVLSSTGQGGHNVVADGYNTDDYYHLNFGWGGGYNGWYLLPDEIPYNLTIIEGAVLDIGVAHVAIDDPADYKAPGISIFPNPVKNEFSVVSSQLSGKYCKIELLNAAGKNVAVLFEGKPGKDMIEFSLGNLPPGIYLCKITIDQGSSTKKLIKE